MEKPEISSTNAGAILGDYLPKLIRLAERNMSTRLQIKVGSDEMAGSIIASVIRMAREGKIAIEESDDFWRLLVAISLNKVRKKVRYYSAQRRDMSRETHLGNDLLSLAEIAVSHGDPTDAEGAVVAKVLDILDQRLNNDCKTVLAGKLEGKSNLEIAELLGPGGKSTKTVTRCWRKVEEETRQIASELELL